MSTEIGKKYSKLTVIADLGVKQKGKERRAHLLCQCECGRTKEVLKKRLIAGTVKSCGCLRNGNPKYNVPARKDKLYGVWSGMKNRCYNPHNGKYERYGKRGIKVCEEWRKNYETFKDWAIREGWEQGLSIERVDNDGNYEPSNCKWVSHIEQARNKSTNVVNKEMVKEIREKYDKGMSLREIEKEFGVKYTTLWGVVRGRTWRGV